MAASSRLFLSILIGSTGFVRAGPSEPPPGALRDAYVLVIFVDGVPARVFDRGLAEGHLPNIDRILVRRGCKAGKGVSSFPTVTFCTQPGAVNGLFPGHCSVPGIKWLEREKVLPRHYISTDFFQFEHDLAVYSPKMAALELLMTRPENTFTRLEGHCTASVQQIVGHDAEICEFFPLRLGLGKVLARLPHRTDRIVGEALKEVYANPEKRPRFTFCCFPDFDSVAHLKGADSPEALKILRRFDSILGELAETLKQAGLFEKTYFVLAADHGNTPLVPRNVVNYQNVLEHAGLRPRKRNERDFDSYVASNSLNSVAIYIGDPARKWKARPEIGVLRDFPLRNTGKRIDLVELLAGQDGSDFLIAGDGPGRVRVINSSSEMVIARRMFMGEGHYLLKVTRGTVDPWGFMEKPKLAAMVQSGDFYSGREWLRQTLDTKYPDAVVQSMQVFDSFRCGDVFISLKPGWKCKASRYVSTHGSMLDTDMHVPLLIAGPDISPKEIPAARLIDIYPTVLRLFGLSVPFGVLDGRPLDEAIPAELCGQQDPKAEQRLSLLPAMRELWRVGSASPDKAVLPHQLEELRDKTTRKQRARLAALLKKNRQRLARVLARLRNRGVLLSESRPLGAWLRSGEEELNRQIEILDSQWGAEGTHTPADSGSEN